MRFRHLSEISTAVLKKTHRRESLIVKVLQSELRCEASMTTDLFFQNIYMYMYTYTHFRSLRLYYYL